MYLPKRTVYLLWYLDIRVVVSMSMLHTVRVMLCTYVAAGCCVACDYKSILFAVHNYTCTTTYTGPLEGLKIRGGHLVKRGGHNLSAWLREG